MAITVGSHFFQRWKAPTLPYWAPTSQKAATESSFQVRSNDATVAPRDDRSCSGLLRRGCFFAEWFGVPNLTYAYQKRLQSKLQFETEDDRGWFIGEEQQKPGPTTPWAVLAPRHSRIAVRCACRGRLDLCCWTCCSWEAMVRVKDGWFRNHLTVPVVPHKAVTEVSKIGHSRHRVRINHWLYTIIHHEPVLNCLID